MGEAPTESEKMAKEYAEQQETAAVSTCGSVSDEDREQHKEHESADFKSESKDLNDEQD